VRIIERNHEREAQAIDVLGKPYLDLTTPLGRGFIAFLSAMAARSFKPLVHLVVLCGLEPPLSFNFFTELQFLGFDQCYHLCVGMSL
jgi:hypothetical protein